MPLSDLLILFIFGLAIGSFLNVVAMRYDGEKFLFSTKLIGGRSHCPHCKKTLQWFELIPLASFLIQRGKCRNCKARLGLQYPIMELLSGIIFMAVPAVLAPFSIALAVVWVCVFEIFLLLSYIDILLGIIPDELNIALLVLGFLNIIFTGGADASVWGSHAIGALVGILIFGGLVALTRGRGMGMGDAKLSLPLGFLFGWPNIFVVAVLAFIIGGVFGVIIIATGKKTMKSAVPFGPFLVLSAVIVFFWGQAILLWYLRLLGAT